MSIAEEQGTLPVSLPGQEKKKLAGDALYELLASHPGNLSRDPCVRKFVERTPANTILGLHQFLRDIEDYPGREEILNAMCERGIDIHRIYTVEDADCITAIINRRWSYHIGKITPN